MLFWICDAFNKAKVDYWVDFGSLLGLTRENGVIMYDNDIDICINGEQEKKIEEANRILKTRKCNFVIRRVDGKQYYRVYGYPSFMLGMADIYINNKKSDTYFGATGMKSNIPVRFVGTPTLIRWNGIDVRVPEHVHDTLVWRYGEDYMVPKRNFKGRDDD